MAKQKPAKGQPKPQQSARPQARKLKGSDVEMVRTLEKFMPRLATVFVVWMLVVHPLLIGPDTYYSLEDVKLSSYWTIASCFLLVAAIVTFIRRWMDPEYLKWQGFGHLARSIRPYERAALAFFLVMVISTILSEHTWWAITGTSGRNEGLFNWSLYLFTMMVIGRHYKPKEKHLLWFCIAAAVAAGYGICQFYGYDFLGFAVEGFSSTGPTITFVSTLSNNNVASTVFGMAVSIGLVMFARMDKHWHLVCLPLAWVSFYMMILGGARSGYVGLAVAFAIGFPVIAKDKKSAARLLWAFASLALWWRIAQAAFDYKITTQGWYEWGQHMAFLKPFLLPVASVLAVTGAAVWFLPMIPQDDFPQKPWRIGWLAFVVVIVVVGIVSVPTLAEKTGDVTITQISEMLQGNIDESAGSGRVFIWKRALELWKEKPIFGHGPDIFSVRFSEQFGEETMETMNVTVDKVHNEYLQVLVDSGLLGLLGLLAISGLLFWGVRKRLGERVPLSVAIAMFFFMAQAGFNFSTLFTNPIVWVMWGMQGSGTQGKELYIAQKA